ncbi:MULTISPECIES: hypothetical protein [unclassified Romboutsia]|uniref:hypothetical protein n=1 Tax=unclassified Romboutsia TaxID=2626894 RepID=UPI001A9B627E|nr:MULTISPECIES: hypothetical protein [unclassified Romboutsia]MDB8804919.1 hypothetical protein [Romboutsia sp. 1001216sp1]MDB8808551.1 hypothetical protein [Romboutsia sp. 1001216sp1]MDB8810564.1 hypothetical protein [Romboutsia sp. 1001216sp1]MDB8816284.1 hypothetical protein [Romboutsia sp. 1001216sp1]MDB8818763.1 hypothetical protein [Romboutsia sp. 1001216sp1]
MKKNTSLEFNSESNVKMTNTTKKRLEGTCLLLKKDLRCLKMRKIKSIQINLNNKK